MRDDLAQHYGLVSRPMDSGRQIVRWSIPGYVFVINILVLAALWAAVLEGRSLFPAIAAIGGAGVVAVAVGGVPVGFLIYQLYYFRYKAYGGLPPFRFYRRDRGARILAEYRRLGGSDEVLAWVDGEPDPHHITQRLAVNPRLKRVALVLLRPTQHLAGCQYHKQILRSQPINCRECRRLYSKRFALNWTTVQSLIDYASASEERAWIKSEYTVGSDLYHALGAARTALMSSVFVGVGYFGTIYASIHPEMTPIRLIRDNMADRAIYVLLGWLVVTASLWLVLTRSRDNVNANFQPRVAAGLAFVSKDLHPG